MASAVVELNHQQSDLSLASMPTRSHAQTIDSIPLDNPINPSTHQKKEETAMNCNHFSIRGYVVELRKRDPKLCDPFSPYRVHEGSLESSHELPPMVVPKFRWWKCDGCVPASGSPTGTVKLAHNSHDDKSAYPAKQVAVKASNVEAPRDQNAELASTSADSNKNRNCSPSVIGADDQKGKEKAHVEDELIAYQTGCKENAIVDSHQTNSISDGIETGALEGFMDHGNGKAHSVSLPDLNEGKAHSDDGDQNEVQVIGNGSVFEEEDDYFGVDSRKAPKVRLLSELLGSKDIQNDAKLKKVKSGDGEVSESESEDESTEIVSEALVKKHGKSTIDERPLLEKRNNKKIKTDHGAYSLMSQMKITPKLSNEKGKSSETNQVFTEASRVKSYQDVHSHQVIDLPRNNDVSADLEEKRSGLAKRKGKMVQIAKEQTSHRERTAFRKDNDILQKGTKHVQNEQSQDTSQIHRLPDSYASTGNDQLHVTPGKNGFCRLPSSMEPLIIDCSAVNKHASNNTIKETSLEFRTSGGALLTQSQFDGTRDRSTGLMTNSKGKQVQIPRPEERSHPIQQNAMQGATSVMNQKELIRRVQNIDINSIPTDEKAPEQGKGDDSYDIPMDIVELMAKNQYERNLRDPRDNKYSTFLSENARSNENTSTYGEQMLKLKQPRFLSWQNSFPKDARSRALDEFEATGSSNQKLLTPFLEFNQTHLSFRDHLGQNQVSTQSLTLSRGQDSYSALNLTAKNWTEHTEAQQRCPPSFLRTMGSYNTCHTASPPRPNVEARVWPLAVGGDMGKSYHRGPSILSFGAVNLEKQINFSNTYNGGNKQKGASSVDLHSNELIPAMHLLSLMQNAGKSELLKRAPSVPDHQQYKQQHHSNQESRHPLLENNGRTSSMQDSSFHPCYPTRPTVRAFTSFQSDGIGRKTSFRTPIPLTSLGQRNIESSHFASLRPQKLGPCTLGRKRKLDSAFNKRKGISGMPDLPSSTNPSQGTKDSTNYPYGLATTHDKKTFCHTPQKEICMLNQNPSEFNDLKELRRYMIRPEDLRPRETRHEKPTQRENAKRQQMRMNRPIPCL